MFDPTTISRRRVLTGLPIGLTGFGLLGTSTGVFAAGLAGDLDTSFATGGKYLSDWGGTTTFGPGIALQANGALVIGGKNKPTTLDQFAGFRLSSSGALDTSFGVNGLVQATFGSSTKAAANDENIKVVTLQFDGKTLLGGEGNAGEGIDIPTPSPTDPPQTPPRPRRSTPATPRPHHPAPPPAPGPARS